MANFTTHIAVGTVVSGGLATLTLAADVIAPENLIAVTLAGVLGSVLPDIDLKDSRPSRALFSGLGIFLSFCVLFTVAYKYSIAEMWLLWLGSFVLFRYGGEAVFHRFSYHRGIWHSILAGVLFGFLAAIVFKDVLGRHEGVAWLAGGFLFVGYVTHLVLDELFSVDVLDTRFKASFGTALKLYDGRSLGDTAVVAIAAALLFTMTPSAKPFVEGISSREMWVGLQQRLLPEDKWFGLVGPLGRLADGPQPGADIATGSIDAAPKAGEEPR
ncbi:MAG: metal-dependent hydrolase [Hyphomicrobiaceae bacterium]|nr:metal-dependent hydrolase [Hyphomicrobiaceae bacterium]